MIVKIVKKKLKQSYPKKNLTLLGKLNSEEITVNILEAHVYVMPSHIENNVNSLCEALLLGAPCIATLAGGVASLIDDKVDGILIQDGDPWVMAGAIIELAQNKEKAISIGENARKVALKRHDKNKIVNDLITHYQEIIESV